MIALNLLFFYCIILSLDALFTNYSANKRKSSIIYVSFIFTADQTLNDVLSCVEEILYYSLFLLF